MIVANTSHGKTIRFDIANEADREALTTLIDAGQITALSILHRGVQTVLTPPKRFGRHALVYGFEIIRNGARMSTGEQAAIGAIIYCQVGEVRISLSATFTGALVRCDAVRTGRQQFDPRGR